MMSAHFPQVVARRPMPNGPQLGANQTHLNNYAHTMQFAWAGHLALHQ